MRFSPLALEGAELVTLGEAEWLELRLEVDGLGCGDRDKFTQGGGCQETAALTTTTATTPTECYLLLACRHAAVL